MLATDRAAVICDFAETYGILDIERVPVRTLCTLAAGLGLNSRIRLKQSGMKAPWDIVLLAKTIDILLGVDKKSDSLSMMLLETKDEKEESDLMVFDSIEAFEARRAAILGA